MKHGHSPRGNASLTYASWAKMRHRQTPPATPPEWESFETFLAEMGERPSVQHGLRRLDPALPYSKSNCVWATRSELIHLYAKHSESDTALYRVWKQAKRRCNDPKAKNYHGRGITMASRWAADFRAFKADVGNRPTPAHTLERLDNDRGYEPGNVCWATRLEQANNLRKNVRVTFQGKTLTLAQWARETGIPATTLRHRIVVKGMPPDQAMR